MKHERQALVLSYVHSNLLVKNLEIAVHEARIEKDPDYKNLAEGLKILQQRVQKTFSLINRKMKKDGVNMELVEQEIEEIHDKSWVAS